MKIYIGQKYIPDETRQRYFLLTVTVRDACRMWLQQADWISETIRRPDSSNRRIHPALGTKADR